MNNLQEGHRWNAEDYCQHSHVQEEAAQSLIQQIQWYGNEQVLDIGCGDGKITAKIADLVKNGAVLGIDVSPEMISFSQKKFAKDLYPNLTFLLQNAEELNYINRFGVIFSSFAIQWVSDQKLLFAKMHQGLIAGGLLALTIPLGISTELESALEGTMTDRNWASYFQKTPKRHQLRSESCFSTALSKEAFQTIACCKIRQTSEFSTRDHFEKYVSQWLPYLAALPAGLQHSFMRDLLDRYVSLQPIQQNGSVLFQFPRLDVLARKISY